MNQIASFGLLNFKLLFAPPFQCVWNVAFDVDYFETRCKILCEYANRLHAVIRLEYTQYFLIIICVMQILKQIQIPL